MPRSDKGTVRISQRDLEALRWIGEQYAVRLDTLRKLLGRCATQSTHCPGLIGESGVRRVVRRWQHEGLIGGRKIFAHQPGWIWATQQGLNMTRPQYFRCWQPRASSCLEHYHQVNEIRLKLEAQPFANQVTWISERTLRRRYPKQTGLHLPDAGRFVWDENTFGVEVELTPKSETRTTEIVAQLAQQYVSTWYFVSPQTHPLIERVVAPYGQRFRIQEWISDTQ